MAYKNSIKVEITTGAGYTATADDATLAGVGAAAYADLHAKNDLCIQTADGEIHIPYHAVDHAIITITREETEDPADPTCVTEETPEP